MSERAALKAATDLLHVPSQVWLVRSEPLPEGVPLLLRIAAGEVDAERTAVALTGRSLEIVRRSTAFFIEQILFAPDADSYRILGTHPQASAIELRRNAALLLRWLHPDLDPKGARSLFVGRVTGAWNNLKTPERRAAYDAQLRSAGNKKARGRRSSGRSKKGQLAAIARRKSRERERALLSGAGKFSLLRRALAILLHRPV